MLNCHCFHVYMLSKSFVLFLILKSFSIASLCGFGFVLFLEKKKKTTTNELLLGFEFEIHGRVVDGS